MTATATEYAIITCNHQTPHPFVCHPSPSIAPSSLGNIKPNRVSQSVKSSVCDASQTMATRVGLLFEDDSSSSSSGDDDDVTPLGIASRRDRRRSSGGRRRSSTKPTRGVDDDLDLMDADETERNYYDDDDDAGDDDATTRALREHEITMSTLNATQKEAAAGADVGDAFGTYLQREEEMDAALNVEAASDEVEFVPDGYGRTPNPPCANARMIAMRAVDARGATTASATGKPIGTRAPRDARGTSSGADAYGARAGSRGAGHAPGGVVGVPSVVNGGEVSVTVVRTRTGFDSLRGALEVALGQSTRAGEDGLKQAGSRGGTSDGAPPFGIAEMCLRHLEAVVGALEGMVEDDGNASRDRAAAEVSAWALLSELFAEDKFGAARGTAADTHRRRAGVSAWLREQVARTPVDARDLVGRRAALTHISSGRTVSATRAAAAHGDPRLATCVAQIGSGQNVAFYAKQQLNRWRTASVGKFVGAESEEAFKLLAGEVERDGDGMNWYQNFGLHLWLSAGPTTPLKNVVKSYLETVSKRRAANPSPPVASHATLEANQATHLRDVAFNILALAATTEEGASPTAEETRVAFHPLTYSDDVLNASLGWHMFTALNAIGVLAGEGMDALADEITVAFVTQLCGTPDAGERCVWAVFVSQHLRDPVRRAKMTGHVLRERYVEWKDDEDKMAFFRQACAVPQEMLDEAKALWTTYSTPRA